MARALLLLVMWTGVALGAPADKALQRALSASHAGKPSARATAVRKLGDFPDPRAFSAVVEALKDSSPVVRLAACSVLARRGDDAAVAPLEAAAKDRDHRVASAAREALGAVRKRTRAGPVSRLVQVRLGPVAPAQASVGHDVMETLTTQLQLQGLMVVESIPQGGRGHQVEVAIQDVRTRTTDESATVEVSAAATVVTWPGHNLRFSTHSSASDGVEGGTVSDEEKRVLSRSAAQAVARALAQDVQGYLGAR